MQITVHHLSLYAALPLGPLETRVFFTDDCTLAILRYSKHGHLNIPRPLNAPTIGPTEYRHVAAGVALVQQHQSGWPLMLDDRAITFLIRNINCLFKFRGHYLLFTFNLGEYNYNGPFEVSLHPKGVGWVRGQGSVKSPSW